MITKITTDSTCDLGEETLAKLGVSTTALSVLLGDASYKDGKFDVQEIFDYVAKTKTLPKTSAVPIDEYREFFAEQLKDCDELVHISVSSKSSACYSSAAKVAEEFGGRIRVVDSRSLTVGQGILVILACKLRDQGKSAKEIEEQLIKTRSRVVLAFVPDSLEYLHKGGRCSLAALVGAKVLKLHPMICENEEGQLVAKKKYMGNMERCIKNLISDLSRQYPDYDKTRCFLAHSPSDPALLEVAREQVKANFDFEEIIDVTAGSIIISHCGKNTVGLAFIHN